MILASLLIAAVCTPLPTCDDLPPSAPAPAVVVQHAARNAGYALPSSLAFSSPNTAGNLIAVAIRAGSQTGHVLSVSDTRGNVYKKAAQLECTMDTASLAIFYAENVVGGTNAITVAEGASVGATRYAIVEVSGAGALQASDTSHEGSGNAAATLAAGSSSDFTLTIFGAQSDAAFTPGANGAAIESVGKLFVQQGATAAILSPATNWAALAVAFKGSGSGTVECATPTPTAKWDQADHSTTRAFRASWKRPEDATWQGSVDLKVWPGDDELAPIWPGITLDVPMQRVYPSELQGVEIEIRIQDVRLDGSVGAGSNILRFCAPKLCAPPGPCS